MILSGTSIRELKILSPHLDKGRINGVSYGESYAGYDIRIAEDLIIRPWYTTLSVTVEQFCMPNNIIGIVHDKSTWARIGMAVQNTVIEPAWKGHLTLEINLIPLWNGILSHWRNIIWPKKFIIRKGTGIAQVLFHDVDKYVEGYTGKYQDQPMEPVHAIFEEDWQQ